MKHPYITPQITIKPANLPKNTSMEDVFEMVKEVEKRFSHAREMADMMQRQLSDQLNRQLETICHNYLDPPIKGEITKGKLRWRGVKGIVQQRQATPNGFTLVFLGIIQRDTLITPTGVKVPYKPNAQDNVCHLPTSTS